MLLVIKARGWQLYSRRSVARSVARRAGRGSRKRILNESMSVSPCWYGRVQEQGTARSSRSRVIEGAYKEGREQHKTRQGELAFGAGPHLGQRRALHTRGWCCERS